MTKTIRSSGHEALREAIIAARKAAGLTQAELAIKLRCHQSFVARIESGQRRIDVVELVVLARATQSDLHKLLEVADIATPHDHSI